MNKAIYFIENKQNPLTEADFLKITSLIEAVNGVGVTFPEDEKNTAYLFFEDKKFSGYRPKLKLLEESPQKILVETELSDGFTTSIIKGIALKLGLKVYFDNLGCYLPKAHFLHECLTFNDDAFFKAQKVMVGLGFTPIFNVQPSDVYFAKYKDGTVHIINPDLLSYLSLREDSSSTFDEFNYKVADNIEDFVRKFDADLIPVKFYDYYKKSLKILNYSGLDLENPGRKIFIKPYIMELDADKIDFIKIAWDNSALLFMDKIRPGENLDRAILRILSEEIKVADDYIGATVSQIIEFDVDKNNLLTPRVIVKIYITKANMTQEQREKKDRGWISFDQVKDMNRKQ